MNNEGSFALGDLVRLKSQPDSCGAVIAVNDSGPEVQYTVLLDSKPRTFFASQIIAAELDTETTQRLSAEQCRAMLTARYINHPGTSTLYSLNAARISFVPYQFRPVLKFIRADRPPRVAVRLQLLEEPCRRDAGITLEQLADQRLERVQLAAALSGRRGKGGVARVDGTVGPRCSMPANRFRYLPATYAQTAGDPAATARLTSDG